ncbi:hypothetical protein ACVXHA_26065 [Escherichia coli]
MREGARAISGDTGLRDVQRLAEANDFPPSMKKPNAVAISKSTCVTLTLITCSVISMSKISRRSSWASTPGMAQRVPVVDAHEARFKALGAPWN